MHHMLFDPSSQSAPSGVPFLCSCLALQVQLASLAALLDSLQALLEALHGCQLLWQRLAPVFALSDAAQHMPSECLTFAQVT